MVQKPPAWSRSDAAGQVPLMLSRVVDTTGVAPGSGHDPFMLAERMIRQQQPAIDRFVAKQRQQIEISGTDVHRSALPLPGIDVNYSFVQGLERMHYRISPEAEAPVPPELPPPTEEPVPKAPEEPPAPEVPEFKKPEEPAPEEPELPQPEEPEKKVLEEPEFMTIDVPFGLAVEFPDGAG
jgi:hypothetical protein